MRQSSQSRQWAPARVHSLRALSATVTEIELLPAAGVVPWSPGSHLQVQLELGGRSVTRHYSLVAPLDVDAGVDAGVASAAGGALGALGTALAAPVVKAAAVAPQVYRIAVKRTQPSRGGSAYMSALRVGDELSILPPANHFELPPLAMPTLLVAGGIGITPLVSMALALCRRGAELHMVYAARSAAELVYAPGLRALLGDRLCTYANDQGQQLDLAAQFAALPARAQAMVCGPLAMMRAAQQAWAQARRPVQALRIETFGAGGAQAAQAFQVSLPRHGLQLTVPAERSLLEVLQDHGVEMLSDCLRGECGLCAIDVLKLEAGDIDHRDVFFSAAERRSGQRLCACVSRVCGPDASIVLDSAWRPDGTFA